MVVLDEVNVQIVNLLLKDARMNVASIAQQVRRAETTVRDRLAYLERQGIITGYHAVVDRGVAGYPMLVVLRAKCAPDKTAEVAKHLASIPNVTQAWVVTGERPILATLRVRDLDHLQAMLQDRLRVVQDVQVDVALESLVDPRQPRLESPRPLQEA